MDEQTVQQSTAWVQDLAQVLTDAHAKHIQSKIRTPQSRSSNYASSLGHPCDLHLTFWRTIGEQAHPISPKLQGIFEEGKKQEDLILRELEDMGVRVLLRGVPIHTDTMLRDLNIHGQLDAKLDCSALAYVLKDVAPDIDWERKRVVAECKSLAPHFFHQLVDYDAIMTAKQHYVRSWGEQMQLYLLGNNDEAGLFIFKNKVTGELRFIPVLLDLETCEAIAQKAKRVNGHTERVLAGGKLPDPIPWRQDVCAECPFLALCPNSREIPPTEISTDEELIDLLERKEQLKDALHEADEIKEQIDHKLEGAEGTPLLVGNFQIRWSKIKATTKVTPEYWRKSITKLPGSQ